MTCLVYVLLKVSEPSHDNPAMLLDLLTGLVEFLHLLLYLQLSLQCHFLHDSYDNIFLGCEVLNVLVLQSFNLLFMPFWSFNKLRQFAQLLGCYFLLTIIGQFICNLVPEDLASQSAEALSECLESLHVVVQKMETYHRTVYLSLLW
jgi:hypothetical protein